jgi:outer membrane biosynthesis protein TonB
MWKAAPLKSSFMLAAILGLIITTIYTVSGRISTDWGVALGIVFACMFFASLISMRRAPIDAQLEYGKAFVHPAREPRFAASAPKKAGKPAKKRPAKKARAKPKKAKKKKAKAKPKKKAAKKKPVKKKPVKKKAAKKKPAKKVKPKFAKKK